MLTTCTGAAEGTTVPLDMYSMTGAGAAQDRAGA